MAPASAVCALSTMACARFGGVRRQRRLVLRAMDGMRSAWRTARGRRGLAWHSFRGVQGKRGRSSDR